MTTLFSPSRLACADEGAAQENRQISTAQLAPEGAPQTEDINGSFQVTRIRTQASYLPKSAKCTFNPMMNLPPKPPVIPR